MSEKKKKNGGGVKKVMNILGGNFLVKETFAKQLPFVVYVTFMLMFIITNTYIAEERSREIARNTRTLNDLHVEYIQLKSSIMQASKQSVLARKLYGIGIKEPVEPVKRINTNNEQPNTEE